jgi:hypothetical protein
MALTGFRDFYPDDCAFRNAIFAKWRDVAHRYGFVEYDGPPLEPLDLFTKKSGDEIVTQLYHSGETEFHLPSTTSMTLPSGPAYPTINCRAIFSYPSGTIHHGRNMVSVGGALVSVSG